MPKTTSPVLNLQHSEVTMLNVEEQRKHRRYQISLPVRLDSSEDEAPQILAATRDISAQGIYFTVPNGFDPGDKFEFDLDLPPALSHGAKVRIHCLARIIRVDHFIDNQAVGVAAEIESYRFIRTN